MSQTTDKAIHNWNCLILLIVHQQMVITITTCVGIFFCLRLLRRVYVERWDALSLRLYITRIDESDAGLYTCTAAVAPAVSRDSQQRPVADTGDAEQPSSRQRRMLRLSQQTKLFLYGQYNYLLARDSTKHRLILLLSLCQQRITPSSLSSVDSVVMSPLLTQRIARTIVNNY